MINFGLLQYPSTPSVSTQVIQRPNYAAQNEQGLLSGLSAMDQAQRTQMEQNRTNAEINAINTKLPYEVGQMQAATAHENAATGLLGVQTKTAQLNLQQEQFKNKQFINSMNTFDTVYKQTGDRNAALDAMATQYAKVDPVAGTQMMGNLATLRNTQIEGYQKQLGIVAATAHQALSEKDPVAFYKSQIPYLKKLAPDLYNTLNTDDPRVFQQMATGAMSIDFPYKEQEMMEAKAIETNKVAQAKLIQHKAQIQFDAVKNDPNASPEEKQRAAQDLQDANETVTSGIYGEGYGRALHEVGAPINKIGKAVSSMYQGIGNKLQNTALGAGVNDLLGNTAPSGSAPTPLPNTPQSQGQQPTSAPSLMSKVPPGNILVKDPSGKTGYIPQDQLNDAIKEGYVQVK